jgi:hypothetical protein
MAENEEEKMIISKIKRIAGLVGIMFFMVASAAYADLYWELEQVTTGMPMQAGGAKIIKNYMTADFSRVESDDGIQILDFNTMTMYILNPGQKTYEKMNLKNMGAQMGMEDPAMQGMMKQMMGEIKVTPTGYTQKIAGYNCKKYMVSMMMVNSEYWLSKEVKGFKEVKAMGKKMAGALSGSPTMQNQLNTMGMMEKLDGFPVKTVTNMMGGSVTTTLKTIQQKSLSKSLFAVPKGYTLKESGNTPGASPSKKWKMPKMPEF